MEKEIGRKQLSNDFLIKLKGIIAMEISVLMSVYNTNNEYLVEAIDSVLNQTFTDFEFLVFDDCTNEENKNILNTYKQKDNRIKIIENKTNLGLTKSLNLGLEIAQGKYIARMDADDVCRLDRLQLQYDYMQNHKDVLPFLHPQFFVAVLQILF